MRVSKGLQKSKSDGHSNDACADPATASSSVSNVPLPLQAAVLVLLILAAYLPASRGGFVWDDEAYVTDNPMLSAPDGLYKIWFSTEHLSQYFPLAYTTLRFAYQLWGLDPTGYHILNILLHCGNSVLIWLLLRKLALPGAWLAAALFAVHPVQVETVAWISEIKTLQSTFFCLLSLFAWVRFIDGETRFAWKPYGFSVFFYCLALLSKTTACTLPAALVLVWWLRLGTRWRRSAETPLRQRERNIILLIIPFCVLGVCMGLLSMWWERQMGHYGEEFGLSFSFVDRVLIAGRAIWFYISKVLWPVKLTFSYPHWNIDPRKPAQYLWPIAVVLASIGVYLFRRRIDKRILIGLIFFVATVSPLIGFIQIYTFRYSFVADHYIYFGDLGLLALIAAGLAKAASRMANERGVWTVCGTILALLSVLTWHQCQAYQSAETLLKDTISKNPGSWMSYGNLGYLYMEQGKTDEAIDCFRHAIQLNPSSFEAINNLGLALSAKGKLDEAIEKYERALELNPKDFSAHNNMGLALAAKGKVNEAIAEYQKAIELDPGFVRAHLNKAAALVRAGRASEAVTEYKTALSLQPDNLEGLNDLAWLRSTNPDASVRNGAEAVQLAERACDLLQYSKPEPLLTLAVAYGEAGRFTEAVAAATKAEALARAAEQTKLADKARELLTLFSAGQPMRVQPTRTNSQ